MTRSLQKGTPAARGYVKIRRAGRRLRRSRRARLLVAAAAICAAAFAVGAWVVAPLAVVTVLDEWAASEPGRTAAAGRVAVNPFTLTVTLHEVALDAPAASVAVERVALDFDVASLIERVIALDALTIARPRLRLGGPGTPAGAGARLGSLLPRSPFAIARTAVSGGRIEWLDGGGAPLVLDGVTASAVGLSSEAGTAASFEIDVRDIAGGALRIDGEATVDAVAVQGRVLFENVDLAPLAARVFASPSIAARGSGAAEFEWRGGAGTLSLRDATLRALRTEIAWQDGSRLSAASLDAAGDAQLGRAPWRVSGRAEALRAELRDARGEVWLEAGRIAAVDAEAALRRAGAGAASSLELATRAYVGTLSLAAPSTAIVLGPPDAADGHRALAAALAMLSAPRPGATGGPADEDGAPFVAVGRIELEGGSLEIIDPILRGAGRTLRALDVEGTIERAEGDAIVADLGARVGEEGSARLRVQAALGDDEPRREVSVVLDGVPADVLAPYAERFAGYAVAGGALDAAVEYRADAGGVDGTASLGARGVDIARTGAAAGAADVRLALALLEDAHGAAQTSVGFHTENDMAIGELLAAALLGRLGEIAAEPFAALGAAAGVDGETLDAVAFRPGEAAPAAPETIDVLADALHARPRVGLRVRGVADPATDRDALAAQQIELHVTLATAGPTLVARPQPVDFSSPRHRDVLDEFAGERLSDEQRETIASYFTRTADGRIVETERSAYYRAIFDALVENESIPDSGIERLGRYRARAIVDGLTARGISEARIEIAPAVVRSGAARADENVDEASDEHAGEAAGDASGEASDDAASGSSDDAAGGVALVEVPLELFVPSRPAAGGAVAEPAPSPIAGPATPPAVVD